MDALTNKEKWPALKSVAILSNRHNTVTIRKKERFALIPYVDYERMLEQLEEADDMKTLLNHEEEIKSGKEELVPEDMVERLVLNDENPILVWREYRGLSQKQLSDASGIDATILSRLENNKRKPSVKQIKAIAEVLNINIDDLV